MHEPIEASANIQNFLVFSFICGMTISSRLRSIRSCDEDEPRRRKDSTERNFFGAPNLFADSERLQFVSIYIAAKGACYETDRGPLQDEARDGG